MAPVVLAKIKAALLIATFGRAEIPQLQNVRDDNVKRRASANTASGVNMNIGMGLAEEATADTNTLEQLNLLLKLVDDPMANPGYHETLNRFATQCRFQEDVHRIVEEMKAMMADPEVWQSANTFDKQIAAERLNERFEGQAKRFSEYVEIVYPKLQEETSRLAERILEMNSNPNFQEDAKRVARLVEAMLADPSFQEKVKHVSEQAGVLMADRNFQDQVAALMPQARSNAQPIHLVMEHRVEMTRRGQPIFVHEQMDALSDPKLKDELVDNSVDNSAKWAPRSMNMFVNNLVDNMFDNVVNGLFDRALRESDIRNTHLDKITLGKQEPAATTNVIPGPDRNGTSALTEVLPILSQILPMGAFFLLKNVDIEGLGYKRHVEVASAVMYMIIAIIRCFLQMRIRALPNDGDKITISDGSNLTIKEYDLGKWNEEFAMFAIVALISAGVYWKMESLLTLVMPLMTLPLQFCESPLVQVHFFGRNVKRPFRSPNAQTNPFMKA